MFVLYPIAGPIAKLLDYLLHDDEESSAYNRGELSALIRIQFEERLARKQKLKAERAQAQVNHRRLVTGDRVGALDFSHHHIPSSASVMTELQRGALRAANSHVRHKDTHFAESVISAYTQQSDDFTCNDSIHADEVTIVEGALQMKTKVALDVMTIKRNVFTVPYEMILNEKNVVKIYASGFSRIPVYKDGDKNKICAVLITKQLIVVNPKDQRPLNTLPLYVPFCVSPNIRLVDLLNLMQTGGTALRGGHLALVCARPRLGTKALNAGIPLPEEAEWMGVITMEDILESLLQEEIYDEMDKNLRDANRLSMSLSRLWKNHRRRQSDSPSLVAAGLRPNNSSASQPTETTSLLGNAEL